MLNGMAVKIGAKLLFAACVISSNANAASTVQLVEGDILTGPQYQARSVSSAHVDRIWPNGIIPYVLHDELGQAEKARILEAAAHWNSRTGITLLPLASAPTNLQRDYVLFKPGQGCASWVGRQGGAQDIWVSAECSTGSVIHEIGHAVGFEHEHTRPDRDQHIEIKWDNIAPGSEHNFHVPTHRVETHGEYDYESIMHYGENFFSSNGSATIVPLNGGAHNGAHNIGQRVALSDGDIAAVASLYGSDLVLNTEQSFVAGNTEVSISVSNSSAQGANSIVVSVPTEGRAIVGQSDNDWQCVDHGNDVQCELVSLASGELSTVVVVVEGEQALSGAYLQDSKKLESNTSNNNVNNNVAASSQAQADSYQNSAPGAGSFGWMTLLIFMPLLARRKS